MLFFSKETLIIAHLNEHQGNIYQSGDLHYQGWASYALHSTLIFTILFLDNFMHLYSEFGVFPHIPSITLSNSPL